MEAKADPPPDNLGSRHRALNKKVNDAISSNADFANIKDEVEGAEVNGFFKIDFAVKCKNVDYIMEIFKSGDTLYATRALKKGPWLFGDEYIHIINPEYLETNIFSVTSERVKRLLLKTIAIRVRREDRAIEFFKYCIKSNLPEIAFKCLMFTSESFKLSTMQNHKTPPYDKISKKKEDYFRIIIGDSLTLLEAYLKIIDRFYMTTLLKYKYLYPINNVKYLELCEKYIDPYYTFSMHFDDELCFDIMTKHKDRVLAKPNFYLELIKTDFIIKHSSVDDVKSYLAALLPDSANSFWSHVFLQSQSDFLDAIPHNERYAFLKKIFRDKYPGEEFEMAKCFYTQHYYKYMTVGEREEWARNQIQSNKQILGVGKDYLWYKFIPFKEAFEEIKNYVIVTKEAERRKGIICVLVHSAKSNRELEIIFRHYRRRHNNEERERKVYFIDKVLMHHNVFEFDEACWNEFYIILLGMELYNTLDYLDCNKHYKTITLFYHILHEKDLPEGLMEYLLEHFYPYVGDDYWDDCCVRKLILRLSEQKSKVLYDYLFKFYTKRFIQLKNERFSNIVNRKVERYFQNILKLMEIYNPYSKPIEVEKNTKCDSSAPACKTRRVDTSLSGRHLLRQLKREKTLVIDAMSEVQKRFENNPFNIDCFLKKIKVYFGNDLTRTFITLFEEVLTGDHKDQKTVNACVKSIFELGTEKQIEEFMKKYAPKSIKIDLKVINSQDLRIQKAICKFACIARPPVALSNILMYMKGDYVKFCLHFFNTYPALMPSSKCMGFAKLLVDAPVSIQKHALRLAFKSFDALKLKEISLGYWKNTKNVSVRYVLYKGLFKRLVETNEKVLFEALKPFTLDLQDTDQKPLFRLVESNNLPDEYLGDFKEAAWIAVSSFKDKQPNIQRKWNLLASIREQIHLMKEEFVFRIIQEHIHSMLNKNKLYICYSDEEINNFYIEKWNLTDNCIVYYVSTNDNIDKYLEITEFIVKRSLEMWYIMYAGQYIYQESCWQFFRQLKAISLISDDDPVICEKSLPIFEKILSVVESNSPLFESYVLRWDLQLVIINRKVVKRFRQSCNSEVMAKVVDESLGNFSEEVANLVSGMVNDKVYFVSYTEKAKDGISDSVKELLDAIHRNSEDDQAAYMNKALITFTNGLIKFQMAEIYLLAVQLLPKDCDECKSNEYKALVDKIKEYSNLEVKHALHQKLPEYVRKEPQQYISN